MSFQMLGAAGSKDERGLLSFELPIHTDTLAETLSLTYENPWGLPEVGRRVEQLDDSTWQVTIRLEGVESESEGETFEMDYSFGEEPLESHPNYEEIKKTYGGYVVDGQLKFVETFDPNDFFTGGLGTNRGRTSPEKNPFFGVKTYLVSRAIFRHTFLKANISRALLDEINTTVDSVPGGFPTPFRRNWLIMPPKIRKRGNVYEIVREYLLSKPGERWPIELYRVFQT